MTDTHQYLEHRLSEASFRRFEPLIEQAVREYPTPTDFTVPANMAPTTFLARIRDAVLSLKRFSWTSNVNTEKLWSLEGVAAFGLDTKTGKIWYRERKKFGKPMDQLTDARSKAEIVPLFVQQQWTAWDDEQIKSLCILLHHKRLSGPITVAGEVHDSFCRVLMESYDVSLLYDEAKSQTIIT